VGIQEVLEDLSQRYPIGTQVAISGVDGAYFVVSYTGNGQVVCSQKQPHHAGFTGAPIAVVKPKQLATLAELELFPGK